MNPSPRQLLLQGLAALRERHQRAQRRAAVHHVMPDDNWYDPGPVKPRQLDPNPRCPDCKTGPMFHPAHPFEPCWVKLPGGQMCGCIVGVVASPA